MKEMYSENVRREDVSTRPATSKAEQRYERSGTSARRTRRCDRQRNMEKWNLFYLLPINSGLVFVVRRSVTIDWRVLNNSNG